MAKELVNVIEYDVITKTQKVVQKEIDMPNPRISEIEQRLQEIRIELQATDYKAIKYAEGATPAADYEAVKVARAELRAEYNALEAELAGL